MYTSVPIGEHQGQSWNSVGNEKYVQKYVSNKLQSCIWVLKTLLIHNKFVIMSRKETIWIVTMEKHSGHINNCNQMQTLNLITI